MAIKQEISILIDLARQKKREKTQDSTTVDSVYPRKMITQEQQLSVLSKVIMTWWWC